MITPTNPITIPAIAAQSADALWITSFTVNAPSPTGTVMLSAIITPYNAESGNMFPSLTKRVYIKDLFALAAQNPDVAIAISGLYGAFQNYLTGQAVF